MPETPIACTLSARDMATRQALIDALAADALLGRTPTPSGIRVRLRDTPEVERGTRELVAAESACCPFLEFELGRASGELVLDVTGPEDALPVIEMFFAAEGPSRV